ncbi:putative amidohydrolase [Neorhizobium galegae]|uniref:nitrilase-related carbon-nitrogen hydrolase n=1 Tax=Neorhizobium galegae TaxID=399 RepID=UPI00277DDE16|nr:nitrilase-related carbon-nitrogen hydrolase [Neorhizobium galegae]MDQ0137719.1 putative amidohydrolase [Neorhizobium galegae]
MWFDLAATTEKTIKLITDAAKRGAQIVAFPEVWLPGYPLFIWLGDKEWQADYRRRYIENSAVYGGPEHERIAAAAAEHHIQVVLGLSERDVEGRIYLAQWLIDEMGETVLARRKLKPNAADVLFYSRGNPDTSLVVADTSLGTVGALNCSEHRCPMLRHVMYGLQEDITLQPGRLSGLFRRSSSWAPR